MRNIGFWETVYIIFMAIMLGILVSSGCIAYKAVSNSPTDAQVEVMRQRYNCVPTNEFVGRDASRLYLCDNGLKYPYSNFHQWAFEENKSK